MGKMVIVILHGWGKSGKDYRDITKLFEKKGFTVYTPDLPGFGKEKITKQALTLDDYVLFVKDYLQKQKIEKCILIGHSLGGRIATKFAYYHPRIIAKLILTGAPLIKKPLSLKNRTIALVVKHTKKFTVYFPLSMQKILQKGIYKLLGEWDYYKAGPLKQTLHNIVQEDLKDLLPFVKTKTKVIWGEKDTFVKESIGREIASFLPNATFISIPYASHRLPYESPEIFAEEVENFLT